MALRDAILATLLDGESSGYDLAKTFDGSIANFWMAAPQQLYRELERMEADGLVEARLVEQAKRPNKRVFQLTPAGVDALRAFAAQEAKPSAIRDDLLVQVQAVDIVEPDLVSGHLVERLAIARERLQRFEQLRDRLLDGREEDSFLRAATRIGPYLTLRRGITFERENIEWCAWAIRVLDARGPACD